MTVTVGDEELATRDEYFTADDPEDTAGPGPGAAADGPPPDDPDRAPYGWTRDTKTREWRPKKSPGRPRTTPPPTPEEVAAAPPLERGQDAPPPPRGRGKRRGPPPTDESVPMPKSGMIAKGVDRLYRRAGRFAGILDDEIGLALKECGMPDPDDPEAPTAGQAWEALARENPRVRAWLLKMLKGGAYQDLFMAHAPLGVALLTRDWVRRLIPGGAMQRAAETLLVPDPDEAGPDDLTPEDLADMQDTAAAQARKMASRMGVKVPPGVAEAAMREAQARAARAEAPEAFQRHQPARGTRAKRKAGR